MGTKKIILLSVVLFGGAFFLWHALFSPAGASKISHVVLISIDTCRADYLGCYGYPHGTTPHIDALARQGTLFEQVVTPVPLTLPAHSSMLTGAIPPYHGVHDNLNYRLADEHTTLAELMRNAGYSTAAFVSSFVLDERFGLNQGFDTYNDDFKSRLTEERKAQETTELACNWLKEHKDEKSFLFVHYYDAHHPLEAPAVFADQYASIPHGGYAAEIAYTDHHIGLLLEQLKKLDLYDSTLIIVTGDHGEAMGEHGEEEHGYYIYDCSLRVPLIIKKPGLRREQRIKDIVGLVDIVPTVCSLMGLNKPSGAAGVDLSECINSGTFSGSTRYLYSESLLPCGMQCNPLLGVSANGWKYIRTTRPELYDLKKDPRELTNIIDAEPKRAAMLEKQLQVMLEDSVRVEASQSSVSLDAESKKRLASLGYIGGDSESNTLEFDKTRPDPKDFLIFHLKQSAIEQDIETKNLSRAKKAAEELVAQYPQVATAHFLLGHVAARQNNWSHALDNYLQALKLEPNHFRACMGAGRACLRLDKVDEAAAFLLKAKELDPDYIEVNFYLGRAYHRQGNYAQAVICLEKMVVFSPDDADVHYNLAVAYSAQDKLKDAVEQFRYAEKYAAERADIQSGMADALNKLGQLTQAVVYYQKAIELDPRRFYLRNQLAEVYVKLNQLDLAVQQWQAGLQLNPDWPYVLNNLAWLYATQRSAEYYNPENALVSALKACELTHFKEHSMLDTLAVAYAENGNYEDAVKTATQAKTLATSAGLTDQVHRIQHCIELYKNRQPYQ